MGWGVGYRLGWRGGGSGGGLGLLLGKWGPEPNLWIHGGIQASERWRHAPGTLFRRLKPRRCIRDKSFEQQRDL